jgi:hypothetical protein
MWNNKVIYKIKLKIFKILLKNHLKRLQKLKSN